MPTFTPDRARSLAGPSWLTARRIAAAERAGARGLPSPAEEIWRYSRIAELDLDAYVPDAAAVVTTISGAPAAGSGIEIGAPEPDDLGRVMAEATDVFADLNDAFAAAPLVIRAARNVTSTTPIVIEHRVSGDGVAVFPRTLVIADPGAELTVVERFISADGEVVLVAPVVEVHAQQGAIVRYLSVNELGNTGWSIASQVASGERDSTTQLGAVILGGAYARVRTDARLVGIGATGEQVAVYFGEGTQMHDVRTLQEHVAPRTTSSLLFKGAVEGHARSVYTGLIKIGKQAKGSTAFQTNRNIKLSDGAWAESVPNLDIENNDVRCSHASAVGPIDPDQRFYLESRGVPPQVAERLIVLGFFDEVLQRLPAPALVPALRAQVAAKLDRKDS